MDNEILKLVLDNNTTGISNPRTREAQIKLWKKFIRKWNATHPTTKVSLKELADEIHLKWPQMYIGWSGNEMYCSFSYVDYIFHNNAQGQICGGMFIREGTIPADVINMTSSQIIDLIGIIRPMPFLGKKLTIKAFAEIQDRTDERCRGCSDPGQTALAWENRAWNLFFLGLMEEALNACTNSLLYKRLASSENRMSAMEAEVYVLMAEIYYFTYQWELAKNCYKICYENFYKVFERADWKDRLYSDVPEEERKDYDNNIVGSYLKWANSYSIFLDDIGNEQESKAIQERYYAVMNKLQ